MAEGRIKLIHQEQDGTLVGATIIGKSATEIIHELNLAVTHGLTIEPLANIVRAYLAKAEEIRFTGLKYRCLIRPKSFLRRWQNRNSNSQMWFGRQN